MQTSNTRFFGASNFPIVHLEDSPTVAASSDGGPLRVAAATVVAGTRVAGHARSRLIPNVASRADAPRLAGLSSLQLLLCCVMHVLKLDFNFCTFVYSDRSWEKCALC
jgi:hypothetical protein